MSVDPAKENERLAQKSFIEWIHQDSRPSEMLTVYLHDRSQDRRNSVYCGLIPSASVPKSLKSDSWDMTMDGGMPGAIEYWEGKQKEVRYLRFGDDDGIEPLLIYREFYGMRHDYLELSEEFRLFHRLYHDRKEDQFIKIDDAGNEHVVAIIEPSRVRVRLLELRQFIAIKEMHLGIFFDCVTESAAKLEDLGLSEGLGERHQSERMTYSLAYGDYGGISGRFAFSQLTVRLSGCCRPTSN